MYGSPIISIEAGDAVIMRLNLLYLCIHCHCNIVISINKSKNRCVNYIYLCFVGGAFTFGFMLLFNIPLNFANIIGLPLLLGIGVDSGIHIADRFRQEHQRREIFS